MSKRQSDNVTGRQLDVLQYLIWHEDDNGYSASVRDICEEFGWTSPNAAWTHLVRLRDSECLSWVTGKARTFRVLPRGRKLARKK